MGFVSASVVDAKSTRRARPVDEQERLLDQGGRRETRRLSSFRRLLSRRPQLGQQNEVSSPPSLVQPLLGFVSGGQWYRTSVPQPPGCGVHRLSSQQK